MASLKPAVRALSATNKPFSEPTLSVSLLQPRPNQPLSHAGLEGEKCICLVKNTCRCRLSAGKKGAIKAGQTLSARAEVFPEGCAFPDRAISSLSPTGVRRAHHHSSTALLSLHTPHSIPTPLHHRHLSTHHFPACSSHRCPPTTPPPVSHLHHVLVHSFGFTCDPRSLRITWPSDSSRPIYDPGQTLRPCVDWQRSTPRRKAQMHF